MAYSDYHSTGLGNYYGTVEVYIELGKRYIQLEDHSSFERREISEELYNLIVKELEE